MPTNSELWSVGMSLGNKIEKPKMDLSCSSFMFCSSWSCTPSIVRDWYVNLVAKIGSLAATQKNLTPQLIVNPIVNLDLAFHRASCSIHYGFVSLGKRALDMGLSLYQLKFHKSLYLVPDLELLLTLVYSDGTLWTCYSFPRFPCTSNSRGEVFELAQEWVTAHFGQGSCHIFWYDDGVSGGKI